MNPASPFTPLDVDTRTEQRVACFTPGPWRLDAMPDKDVGLFLRNSERVLIETIYFRSDRAREEIEANAHLIAAAPELLSALRLYVDAGFGQSTDPYKQGEAYDAAIEAIAKATGLAG
jgi:hypothetical protein